MTRRIARFVAVIGTALGTTLGAHAASAQVGTLPQQSPFKDLESRQQFTFLGGYFFAPTDPAKVAPQSAPFVGVQYDLFLGGPASFTAAVGSALSERNVIDPARPLSRRLLGVEKRPLTLLDVGFTFALTGQKSYHGFVPLVHGGVGLASNFRGEDPGGLKLGTRFALNYGVGMRYVPAGRWSLRADLGYHAFQLRYPDRYFAPALDSTSVLPSGGSKSRWLNNKTVTLGASYQLFR